MSNEAFSDNPALRLVADNAWNEVTAMITSGKPLLPTELRAVLDDTIARAHACGHRQGLEEGKLIRNAMEEVFEARQEHVAASAIASIMDHLNLSELTINLDRLATVWRSYTLSMHLDGDKRSVTFQAERKVESETGA